MPRTVLIAFDGNNPALSEIQRIAFEAQGWTTYVYPDALEALHLADRFRVNLVVTTDFLQPLSGFDLCSTIRRIPRMGRTRVVILSASHEIKLEDATRSGTDLLLPISAIGNRLVQEAETLFTPSPV